MAEQNIVSTWQPVAIGPGEAGWRGRPQAARRPGAGPYELSRAPAEDSSALLAGSLLGDVAGGAAGPPTRVRREGAVTTRRWSPVASFGVLAASTACLVAVVIGDQRIGLAAIGGLLLASAIGAGRLYIRAGRPLPAALLVQLAARDSWEATTQGAPRLGELLVYHYHWIRKVDLDRALALQQATSQPLGEILVGLRLITPRRLARALLEQRVLQTDTPVDPAQGQ